MSNELSTLTNMQLPAHLQKHQSKTALALAVSYDKTPKISIKGSKWTFITDDVAKVYPNATLTVVILGVDPPAAKTTAKAYFTGPYVQGSTEPPDCSSADGLFPDSFITHPQHANCTQCPKNAWGSAKSNKGEDRKACSDSKRLYVTAPNGVSKGTIYSIQVPPTSFGALSKYGRELAAHSIPVEGVITELSFAPAEHPQIEFKFGGFLDEVMFEAASARAQSEEVQSLLHYPPKIESVPVQQAPAQRVEAAPALHAVPSPPTEVTQQAPVRQAPVQQVPYTAREQHHAPASAPAVAAAFNDPWSAPHQQAQAVQPQAPVTFVDPWTAAAPAPVADVARNIVQGHVLPQASPSPAHIAQAYVAAAAPQGVGHLIDKSGTVFNPAIHAVSRDGSPSLLKDGTFRTRRGVSSAPVQQAPVQQAPMQQAPVQQAPVQQAPVQQAPTDPHTGSSLDSVLRDWS